MPYFSIIIPTYNRATYLADTLNAVLNQTYENWECIVIDDGSTDNTRDVLKGFVEKDARIKYVYQTNAERSVARNNGINRALGTYVCFLDSDDKYFSNHLEVLFDEIQLQKAPKALLFTNYIKSENGLLEHVAIPNLDTDVLTYLFKNPIIPARVCIHKSILEKEQFDAEVVVVEDLLLWIRISFNYPIIHLKKTTVIYNLHDDNSVNISKNSAQKRLEGLNFFFSKYTTLKKQIPSSLRNFCIGDTHFGLMKYYLFSDQKLLALKEVLASIYYQGFHSQLKHKLYIISKLLLGQAIPEYTRKGVIGAFQDVSSIK